MVYGFIKQSGGHMGVYSELGTGTEIRMYLPVYTRDEVSIPAAEPAATSGKFINGLAQQHATVLVVEDEELVRQYAEKQFRELGFEVVSASNGNEALARLDECLAANKRVDLLFSDVMMSGGINGPELAKLAQEKQANLPVLFTSGYSENAISHQGRLQSGAILLSKPWRRDDLAQKLEKMDLFKSTR
jgi:CheY-like chemotaxis protein